MNEKERWIRIVDDPEKGPTLSFDGFKYLAKVITLLGIGQEIVTNMVTKQMKQNSAIIHPPFNMPRN